MKHGDADKIADYMEQIGSPLVPWQRDFLNRLESASINEQFRELATHIVTHMRTPS